MANGKQHDIHCHVATATLMALCIWRAPISGWSLLLIPIGCWFGGLFLSPDLDCDSRPLNRWGLLKLLWIPYRDFFKHRGASHQLLIGTLTRVLYPVFWPLWWLILPHHWLPALCFVVGVEISEIVHYWGDGILMPHLKKKRCKLSLSHLYTLLNPALGRRDASGWFELGNSGIASPLLNHR